MIGINLVYKYCKVFLFKVVGILIYLYCWLKDVILNSCVFKLYKFIVEYWCWLNWVINVVLMFVMSVCLVMVMVVLLVIFRLLIKCGLICWFDNVLLINGLLLWMIMG